MRKGEDVPRVRTGSAPRKAVAEITRGRLGMTAVLDADGIVRGIFTDGDLRRALEKGALSRRASVDRLMTAGAAHHPARGARGRGGADHGEAQGQPAAGGGRARRAGGRAQHARPVPRESDLKAVSRKRRSADVLARARAVRLMIFDVDGVLTDGTLLYRPSARS
jgi:CBS domain-containing protein